MSISEIHSSRFKEIYNFLERAVNDPNLNSDNNNLALVRDMMKELLGYRDIRADVPDHKFWSIVLLLATIILKINHEDAACTGMVEASMTAHVLHEATKFNPNNN